MNDFALAAELARVAVDHCDRHRSLGWDRDRIERDIEREIRDVLRRERTGDRV